VEFICQHIGTKSQKISLMNHFGNMTHGIQEILEGTKIQLKALVTSADGSDDGGKNS
jgi:hypothetical protein